MTFAFAKWAEKGGLHMHGHLNAAVSDAGMFFQRMSSQKVTVFTFKKMRRISPPGRVCVLAGSGVLGIARCRGGDGLSSLQRYVQAHRSHNEIPGHRFSKRRPCLRPLPFGFVKITCAASNYLRHVGRIENCSNRSEANDSFLNYGTL